MDMMLPIDIALRSGRTLASGDTTILYLTIAGWNGALRRQVLDAVAETMKFRRTSSDDITVNFVLSNGTTLSATLNSQHIDLRGDGFSDEIAIATLRAALWWDMFVNYIERTKDRILPIHSHVLYRGNDGTDYPAMVRGHGRDAAGVYTEVTFVATGRRDRVHRSTLRIDPNPVHTAACPLSHRSGSKDEP